MRLLLRSIKGRKGGLWCKSKLDRQHQKRVWKRQLDLLYGRIGCVNGTPGKVHESISVYLTLHFPYPFLKEPPGLIIYGSSGWRQKLAREEAEERIENHTFAAGKELSPERDNTCAILHVRKKVIESRWRSDDFLNAKQ